MAGWNDLLGPLPRELLRSRWRAGDEPLDLCGVELHRQARQPPGSGVLVVMLGGFGLCRSTMFARLIQESPSDSRKQATSATSESKVRRPSGDSLQPTPRDLLLRILGSLPCRRGEKDGAGAQGVHAYAVRTELPGQGRGEVDGRLGRPSVDPGPDGRLPAIDAMNSIAPRPRLELPRLRRIGRNRRMGHVHGERRAPGIGIMLSMRGPPASPPASDEQLQASDCADSRVDEISQRARIGDVDLVLRRRWLRGDAVLGDRLVDLVRIPREIATSQPSRASPSAIARPRPRVSGPSLWPMPASGGSSRRSTR